MAFINCITNRRQYTLGKLRLAVIAMVLLFVNSTSTVQAQNCGDVVYDSGGAAGDYSSGENTINTYNAPTNNTITVSFSSFNLENTYDYLYIYDGSSISDSLLATLTGTSLPSSYTTTGNSITLRLTSDGTVVRSGYAATINCNAPPAPGLNGYAIGLSTGNADLYLWDDSPATTSKIGDIGTSEEFESISLNFDGTELYTSNGADFGTLHLLTGAYTSLGTIGTASGPLGTLTISDVDGMTLNPLNGMILAIERRSGDNDLLFAINPITGNVEANYFGASIDYKEIKGPYLDIEDVAFDPTSNELYGISTVTGATPEDKLLLIDMDFGTVTIASDLPTCDMEGLSFNNSGELYGVLGENACTYPVGQIMEIDFSTSTASVTNIVQSPLGNTKSLTWYVSGVAPCQGISDPGSISSYQDICSGDTPNQFTNVSSAATAAAGTIQYQWYESTISCMPPLDNDAFWSLIPGATAATYQPGALNQRTCFVRSAINSSCTTSAKFSNVVTVDVRDCACPTFENETFIVSSSVNDAEEARDGSMLVTGVRLDLTEQGSDQVIGIRFSNVNIPVDATIESAKIEFRANDTQSEVTNLIIEGEKNVNSAAFSTTNSDVSSRPTTNEKAVWSYVEPWTVGSDYMTIDFRNVIQEIIDQPGWASGNALSLIISGTGLREAVTFDASSTNAPELIIQYCSVEICGNGIDDDLDGYADNFDTDCAGYAPFNCDKTLYQTSASTATSDFYLYEMSSDPLTFTQLHNLNSNGMNGTGINSIAFNPVDRFIYGINPYASGSDELFMINADGDVMNVGNVTGLSGTNEAGCMDINGNYYVTGSSQSLWSINLSTLVATQVASLGFVGLDMAFNPSDGYIYIWDSTNSRLKRIDPSDGSTTNIGAINTQFSAIGAMYFDEQGDIIAFGNDTSLSSTTQETLMKIDPITGAISIIEALGSSYNFNDGCSCSFGVALTKSASSNAVDPGQTIEYTYTIYNRTGSTITNLNFDDVLPAGLSWGSDPYNVTGITMGSNSSIIGSQSAALSIASIPSGATNSFTLSVQIPTNYCTDLTAQASLSGLAAEYGSTIQSDDPNTADINDATTTIIENCEEHYFEVECGTVGSNWNFIDDASVSAGTYLTIGPSGNSFNSAPTSAADRIRLTADISVAGVYNIFGRVNGPSSSDDSFWVRVNEGTWYKWNGLNSSGSWVWRQVWDFDNGNALVQFNMNVGLNTIDIAYREDGTLIDKILVTLDNETPTGLGGTAYNCVEICGNGVDDDNDGLVDCADDDCNSPACQGPCDPGQLIVEGWLGVGGDEVTDLTGLASYPNNPDTLGYLYEFNFPDPSEDTYGIRASGYLIPSETGTYSFNITGDDNTILYLSTDNDIANKVQIADIPDYTSPTQYNKYASQTSIDIELKAGVWYFIELLSKEDFGASHFSVRWQTPSSTSYSIIQGANLAPSKCPELCYNGVDDDGDGAADCGDSDCANNINLSLSSSASEICEGENVTISTTVSAAAGLLTYSWSNGATTPNITVAPNSTTVYGVTVTNIYGCFLTDQISVTVNSRPAAMASHDGEITCLKTTATLTAAPSGMSYLWTGGDTGQTKIVSTGGTYNVTVTDSDGCTSVASVDLPENNDDPMASAGSDQEICIGESATLTATGGISYLWSDGNTGNVRIFAPSTSTFYSVTVTGANGCTAVDSAEVIVHDLPVVSASHDGTITCADPVSTLTASPAGLKYNWTGGGSGQTIGVSDEGTYFVTVTDANGCSAITSVFVPKDTLAPLASAGINQEICVGEDATLVASGGVSYEWPGGISTASNTVSPAVTTTYTVTVTASNGCTATDDVQVTVLDTPNATANNDGPITCAQTSVVMTAFPSGQSYVWQGGGTDQDKIVNVPGTYSVTVTNYNGCTSVASTTVAIDTSTIIPALTVDGIISCDVTNVKITAEPAGSNFSWSTGASGNEINVTFGGEYSVTLTGANGCSETRSINVIEDNTKPTIVVSDESICAGDSVTLSPEVCEFYPDIIAQRPLANSGWTNIYGDQRSAMNGNGSLCFDIGTTSLSSMQLFGLNDDAMNSDFILDMEYSLLLSARPDINNYRVEVRELNVVVATFNYTQAEFDNSNYCITRVGTGITYYKDGTLLYTSLIPSGTDLFYDHSIFSGSGAFVGGYSEITNISLCGELDMEYLWSTGDTTQNLEVKTAGNYTFNVIDAKGCNRSSTAIVNVNPLPNSFVSGTGQITCDDPIITLTANPAGMDYLWSDGSTMNTLDVSMDGTYAVTVTNASGCSSVADYDVTTAPPPTVSISGSDEICIGEITSLSPSVGGTWISSDTDVAIVSNSGLVVGTMGGSATFTFIEASTGCSATTAAIQVSPEMSISMNYMGGLCLDVDTQLGVDITGGTPGYSYNWTGPSGFVSTDSIISVPSSGNYYVTVTDAFGCEEQTSGYIYEAYDPFIFTLNSEICEGESVNLSVNSSTAISYIWSSNAGDATSSSVTVVPSPPSEIYYVTITNDLGCESVATMTIDVNPKTPVSVTGDTIICSGETTTLSPNSGGTWASSNTNVATVTPTGIVSGVGPGTVTFIFTDAANNCESDPTEPVTVQPKPVVSVTGPTSICEGDQSFLSPTTGGFWTSSNESVATVTDSGVITGIGPGTVKFIYESATTGCFSDSSVQLIIHEVYTPAITGITELCEGEVTYLTPTTGGTWSSSDESVAVVNAIGVVTAVGGGTASFTFTSSFNCVSPATADITVIDKEIILLDGSATLCQGDTTHMSASLANGTWSSSNNSIAFIDASGVVTGISGGFATLTYTPHIDDCADASTFDIEVLDKPSANINGPAEICEGSSSSVTTSGTGGTWYSTDSLVAIVTNDGTIVGVNAGTARFIYIAGNGCVSDTSTAIIINPAVEVNVSFNGSVCLEDDTELTANFLGGTAPFDVVWSGPGGFTSTDSIISIPISGTYTAFVTDAAGCTDDFSAIVYESYEPYIFTLDSEICEGQAVTLSINASNGGSFQWSANAGGGTTQAVSVNPAVPSEGYTVTVTSVNGCTTEASSDIIVNPTPIISLLGDDAICEGGTTTLSPSTDGTWSSSDYSVATINNSGVVTGLSPGIASFIYRDDASGCFSDASEIVAVSNNIPLNVLGEVEYCIGTPKQLTCSVPGGEWSSSNQSVATVDATTGMITPVSQGSASITYAGPVELCYANGIRDITIYNLPSVNINGPSQICENELTYLIPTNGGVWTSSDTDVATVSSAGVVTGIAGGDVSFTFTSTFGCVTQLGNMVTVVPNPIVGVNGNTDLCIDETTELESNVPGIWITSNELIASVNSGGIVTAHKEGTAEFTFIEFTNGCSSAVPISINVNGIPSISGLNDDRICVGESTNIYAENPGIWTSSDETVATIDVDGLITAIGAGAVTFVFQETGTGCISSISEPLTVDGRPSITVVGSTDLCLGESTNILPSSGGVWTSSDVSIASINNQGEITANSEGTVSFTFISGSTGCSSLPSDDFIITNPTGASISAPADLCIGETSILIGSNSGTWSSSNPAIGAIDNAGLFTAVAPGLVTITLNTVEACIQNPTVDIFVNPLPVISFIGESNVCIGSITNLSPLAGGTWTSSDTTIARITDDGTVTAMAPGNSFFTFTDTISGCSSTTSTSLNVFEAPLIEVAGDVELCIGGASSMSPSSGGVWSSSNETVATISSTGLITGVSPGSVTFTFVEYGTGCSSDESPIFTVLPKPLVSITGENQICVGATTSLSPSTGGSWVSDNESVATVEEDGTVTAVSQGVARFTFISNAGCVSNQTPPIIVINGPTIIMDGSPNLCLGDTLQMLPNVNGTWTSSDNTIATITDLGVVSAISEGEVTFMYTDTIFGCVSDPSDIVTINPSPDIALIGPSTICSGGLTNMVPSTGGLWISLDPSIAAIDNNGEVTGVMPGQTRFIFTQLNTGCSSDTSELITVSDLITPVFTGRTEICIGDTTYIEPSSGGQWISTDESIATINDAGMIIGVAQGTAKFQYSQSGTGCNSALSDALLVNGTPPVSNVGPSEICIGSTTELSPSGGGTWESLQSGIATVDSNGIVTGIANGVAYFVFTDSLTGCQSNGQLSVSVQSTVPTSILGDSEICAGYTTSMSPSSGGYWSSTNPEVATITNAGIVTGHAAGDVSFIYVNAITGCMSDPSDVVSVGHCKNHDFNVTVTNQLINGNLSTNDQLPVGSTYSPSALVMNKPAGSIAVLDIENDGTYSFSANVPGDYYYLVPVCGPGANSGCPTSILEITVLDNIYSEGNASTNMDIVSVFQNETGMIVPNNVALDVIANDKCVYTAGGCAMDYTSLNVTSGPSNGTYITTVLGEIIYTPNDDFVGIDTIHYEACTAGGTDCNPSMQVIYVNDITASNTVMASDDFGYTIAGTSMSGSVSANDVDPEMDNLSVVPQGTLLTPIVTSDGSYYIEANGFYMFTPSEGFSGGTEIVYTICDDNVDAVCMDATLHILVFDDLSLTVKVYLEGALRSNNNENSILGRPLMRDNLRNNPINGENYIPTKDPYTTAFNIFSDISDKYSHMGPHLFTENQVITDSIGVFGVTGDNAIVDWIHIELRSKDDINLAIASRAGLLQRDGDVVDLDGVSPLKFQGVNVDSFYVVAKHRSHLAVMSEKVQYSELIDFTDINYPVYNFGTDSIPAYDFTGLSTKNTVKSGYRACWAGDLDSNGKIKFTSPSDDQNAIFTDVFFSSPDFLINYDNALGYFLGDFDMNGKVKFTNPNDDKNLLFSQILLFPLNEYFIANFNSMIEQVPARSN